MRLQLANALLLGSLCACQSAVVEPAPTTASRESREAPSAVAQGSNDDTGTARVADDELERAMRGSHRSLRDCYAGDDSVMLIIRGDVDRSGIVSSKVVGGREQTHQCVTRVVDRWRFSPADNPRRFAIPVVFESTRPLAPEREVAVPSMPSSRLTEQLGRGRGELRSCVTQYEGEAAVRFDVEVSVEVDGSVSSVNLVGEGPRSLTDCVESAVRGWRFSPAVSEMKERAMFPLVIQGGDER